MDMTTTNTTDTTTMDMSMMAMTFFTATTTPLYSAMWTPASDGAYAGTCIFLIILAVIHRALFAVKALKETQWMNAEFNRRYVVVNGKQPKSEQIMSDSDTKTMILSENGVEENVMVVQQKKNMGVRPWRITVEPMRAVLDTTIAGVTYLLYVFYTPITIYIYTNGPSRMLGVMTMNVGYFLSILGGTFLGSLALARYSAGGHYSAGVH